ncbi:MAG: AzlD domain-containing protein [Anaerolineae bacterium]|nr:AzlD domain-containing protein [Anaerolineae bacterium]
MSELYLIAGMAVVTFVIRYSMFAVAGRFEFPDGLNNALRYVPPTVLTAIIVPAVLMPNGEAIDVSWTNAYLVGAIVAAVIGWTSENLLLTIVVGMGVFFGWQWLVG